MLGSGGLLFDHIAGLRGFRVPNLKREYKFPTGRHDEPADMLRTHSDAPQD